MIRISNRNITMITLAVTFRICSNRVGCLVNHLSGCVQANSCECIGRSNYHLKLIKFSQSKYIWYRRGPQKDLDHLLKHAQWFDLHQRKNINMGIMCSTLQVCEGDDVEVKVWNRLGNSEGTSIHWRGIHQRDTPYMDGAAMITQCPISPQSSFTYNFEVQTNSFNCLRPIWWFWCTVTVSMKT